MAKAFPAVVMVVEASEAAEATPASVEDEEAGSVEERGIEERSEGWSTSIDVLDDGGVLTTDEIEWAGGRGGSDFFCSKVFLRILVLLDVRPGVPLAGSFLSIELEWLTTMVE